MIKRLLARLAAVALVGAAAGVGVTAAPAQAAKCAPGSGVTVVVNNSARCDSDGGGNAFSNFRDAGHALTQVKTQPGFVCQVDGAPASDCAKTPPKDAYWGLFWSDGKSGWKYSSEGVSSLNVPQGGSVAFVFQNSTSKTYPSVSAPKSGGSTSGGGSSGGGSSSGGSGAAGGQANGSTPSATPSAKATKKPDAKKTKKPDAKKSAKPTDDPTSSAGAASASDDMERTAQEAEFENTTLWWIGGTLALFLVLGSIFTVIQRQRASGS